MLLKRICFGVTAEKTVWKQSSGTEKQNKRDTKKKEWKKDERTAQLSIVTNRKRRKGERWNNMKCLKLSQTEVSENYSYRK